MARTPAPRKAAPAPERLPSRKKPKEKAPIKGKAQKQTVAIQDEWKGFPVFQIWEADENGEPTGKKPLVSFGLTKVGYIGKHIKDMKTFFEEHKHLLNRAVDNDSED